MSGVKAVDIIAAHELHHAPTGHPWCRCGETISRGKGAHAKHVVSVLAASGHTIVPTVLLSELVDPDPCWFDHNGGCQAHGHFPPDVDQAWTCPVESAKTVLAADVTAEEDK